MSESNVNESNIINSLSSADELEDGTNMDTEDNTQQVETELIGGKRTRDENSSEDGWSVVNRGRSKLVCSREQHDESIREERTQVCVTCKEPLPKQFALARLFKTRNIPSGKIYKIKYVHKYKMLITFDNDMGAEEFIKCSVFTDMGWSCQKTSEVGVSYGLIRAMELDISDEDLKSNLSSSAEITSIKRLNKRCSDDPEGNGWSPSETIRLGFKGPSLPAYVYIYNLRIPVERFVFPVTQCANCWKFGHLKIRCPSKQPVCPKCSLKHLNCTTTSFTCVNCSGCHMALDKVCPSFKKEKKLRDIMSEFNCTYRKALTLYVPPSPVQIPQVVANPTLEGSLTYAAITKSKPLTAEANVGTALEINDPDTATTNIRAKPKRTLKKHRRPVTPTPSENILWHHNPESSDSSEKLDNPLANKNEHLDKTLHNLSFWHMIRKISNIIKNLSKAVAERRLALAKLRGCPSPRNLDILKEKISTAQRLIRKARCKSFQQFCTSVDETTSASEMWRKMRWLKSRQVPNTSVDKEKAERLLKDLTPDFYEENDVVDMLAKQACVDGVTMNVTPLFSDYFRKAKNKCFDLWQEYFDERYYI
ncbi:hypothetical protein B5X24_HaOG208331 [Helicoverpa armigera]|nr:hypothetical protein B5X24_HaOG208331 [Helicoverpa armigera]